MGPILKPDPKKEPSIEEIVQNDDNNDNNNNIDTFCNPEHIVSQYLNKKRKIPDGGGKENVNQLNRNVPSETISQLKQKLEENEEEAKILKEEILQKKKELDEINEIIKNIKNELDILEEYKEIKNNFVDFLDSQLSNYEEMDESKDVIENIMNDYWNNNQKNLLPLYQSLNPNTKKNVKNEISALEKLYQKTYLQTMVIKKKKFENENTSIYEEALDANKYSKEHKFPKEQLINNNINKNFDEYSFKCLTNNLNYKILKGTKEVSFRIELVNDGYYPWPKNETFLLTDETKSMIKSEKISLDPLNPRAQKLFDIKFKNMNKLEPGVYKINFSFYAKGKSFGNKITFYIEVYE